MLFCVRFLFLFGDVFFFVCVGPFGPPYIVAMVTYCATQLTATRSPMTGQFVDTMILASTDKDRTSDISRGRRAHISSKFAKSRKIHKNM